MMLTGGFLFPIHETIESETGNGRFPTTSAHSRANPLRVASFSPATCSNLSIYIFQIYITMSTNFFDKYDEYEQLYDPIYNDRQARRLRKPRVNPNDRKQRHEKVREVADTVGLEAGLNTTYTPSRHEEGWLTDSLRDFLNQELISDVNALVKGGKEANVYRCRAHDATGEEWLAVKVYRPRMFRNLRNDKQYRQGRVTLMQNGRAIHGTDQRAMRAMGKKTAYGQQLTHTSWLMYEYTTLEILHAAGAAVPRPIASSSNAILMGYVGDERIAAPTLNQINLKRSEARALFAELMRNVALLLENGRIHGDLSAYNILYWDGNITLIDFPQVVNSFISRKTHALGSQVNPDAYDILHRDITRVCDYFQRFGISDDPRDITDELWQRYTENNTENKLADLSWYLEGEEARE
ncbi:MAG: hypothetical protein DWQ04_26275 [Chloroflexi bacterium]|nr:MAG: hypothetical protein DWQ04_26275 [Chloroflexota bacterium]